MTRGYEAIINAWSGDPAYSDLSISTKIQLDQKSEDSIIVGKATYTQKRGCCLKRD
jgi:hypothetical protein